MKTIFLLQALLFSFATFAQTGKQLPHGTYFGRKPDETVVVNAEKLQAFMAQKPRITIAVKGKVAKVIKEKGGWFDLDAGSGKVIAAHFKDYNINIPANLKGHTVIVEGVAQKQIVSDDQQHFAGANQPKTKDKPNQLTFEATGLMVE
jgi:pectate lyase